MSFLLNINKGALLVPILNFQENAFIEDGTDNVLHYTLICRVSNDGDYQSLLDNFANFCLPDTVTSIDIYKNEKLLYTTARYNKIAREDLVLQDEEQVIFNINFDYVSEPIIDPEEKEIDDIGQTYEELDGEIEQVGG